MFFKDEQAKWKGKKGLYVIECPLFSSSCAGIENKRKVYKVGYAYQSLAVRIGDYRTHYGKTQTQTDTDTQTSHIPRERVNREREYKYIYTCIYMYNTFIYIYINVHTNIYVGR